MRVKFVLVRVGVAVDVANVSNILVEGISGTPGLAEMAMLKVSSQEGTLLNANKFKII